MVVTYIILYMINLIPGFQFLNAFEHHAINDYTEMGEVAYEYMEDHDEKNDGDITQPTSFSSEPPVYIYA